MVIAGIDGRNIDMVIDLRHAKYLVALLRTTKSEDLVAASEDVQADGFDSVTALDIMSASTSFCSVIGFITDQMKNPPTTITVPIETPPKETTGEEHTEPEKKVYIN